MEYIVDDKNWTHLPLLRSSNKYGKAIMILKKHSVHCLRQSILLLMKMRH